MKFNITEVAELELKEVVSYYNNECPGLGYEFDNEVQNAFGRILRNPEAWTSLSSRTRRSITRRFPYAIIYQIRPDEILIVAIMHMHRDPKLWEDRL